MAEGEKRQRKEEALTLVSPSESKLAFFAAITGLPLERVSIFPELSLPHESAKRGKRQDGFYTVEAQLGHENAIYSVSFKIKPAQPYPGNGMEYQWSVAFNGRQLAQQGWGTGADTPRQLDSYLHEEFVQTMRGPDPTATPFMDFNGYSVEDLNDRDKGEFFLSPYLLLMTHMRERGMQMPPILSLDQELRDDMLRGRTAELEKKLAAQLILTGSQYDKRCQAHMRAEADEMIRVAEREHSKRNPDVPLEDAFRVHVWPVNLYSRESPAESTHNQPYTILAVGNRMTDFFGANIIQTLARDKRLLSSRIIDEFILDSVVDLSRCGRVDIIVFDDRNPDPYEVAWLGGGSGEENHMYRLFHGNSAGVLDFDEQGNMHINTRDGSHFDSEASMKKKARELDIRRKWMSRVEEACREEGIEPPPFAIIYSEAEFDVLEKIVAQKLGMSPLRAR